MRRRRSAWSWATAIRRRAAGIAQMGPAGDPILLPTPSLQTNFSPTSLAFWQEVYAEMAAIQAAAGLTPFLQFGEVQWWYFPNNGDGVTLFRACRSTMRGSRASFWRNTAVRWR